MLRKTLILTLLIALMTACAPQATPTTAPAATEVIVTQAPTEAPTVEPTAVPAGITLTDGLGREVTLDAPAQHVVSLAPSNTEILFAVGAGSQVVGRDELSDFPEEAKSLPSVGGSMGDFNAEAIVALNPDLVLATGINSPELVKQLEDLGLTVFYLGNPTNIEEMYVNLETVAQLTSHEEETKALIESLQARVKAVDEKIATASERPTVFYELDATDPTKPWTTGPGTFIDQLITRAGGVNIAASMQGEWVQISSEEVVKADPQVILLSDAAYGMTAEAVMARSGWDVITAVKNSAIYPFNPDLASRPGPRLVDALEEMAKLLHPELYK